MTRIRVRAPKRLSGTVEVPGDKSISHRAALVGAIASGRVLRPRLVFDEPLADRPLGTEPAALARVRAALLDVVHGPRGTARGIRELVDLEPLAGQEDIDNVRTLLERHFVATKSNLALEILTNWDDYQELFWMVIPRGTGAKLEQAVSAKEG